MQDSGPAGMKQNERFNLVLEAYSLSYLVSTEKVIETSLCNWTIKQMDYNKLL